MLLSTLLQPWVPAPNIEISGLHNDSREIKPGYLFFAYPGAATDGRLYIAQALAKGAQAIIYEPADWPDGVAKPLPEKTIAFPGLVHYLAAIAKRFYGEPSKLMRVSGVTGTNGKTTIAYQLAQAHEKLGQASAYIGTLGHGQVSSLQTLANTTPDALFLQNLFNQYQKIKIKHVCLEVSSHALDQGRVAEIEFHQGIFTNLTLDHLDYHHTMDAYARAKAQLFAYPSLQWAIVNQDDSYAPLIKAAVHPGCKLVTYGIKEKADVQAVNVEVTLTGTCIEIISPWGKDQLMINALGFFNVYNALAIYCSLMLEGYEKAKVIEIMSQLKAAPGRMEIVTQKPYIIVDYAHTPDALENVLLTLNQVKQGRIVVVFGCGGDRDKSKRPLMGNIAARYSDTAIITSDNPRTENPQQILMDIEQGIGEKNNNIYSILDREEAIAKAMSLATERDIVLIAGKGHESYQQIGHTRHFFSDQAVVRRLSGEND